MPALSNLPKKTKKQEQEEIKKRAEGKYGDRIINNITFFGDSALPSDDPIYKTVFDIAKHLAEHGYTIVNGGGPGLMKAATDGAESINGETEVVYWEPKLASFFEGKNLANIADETDSQSNYVIRTLGLIERGDVYIVCKGGTGTISEFGLVWCLAKLYFGVHKPIILFGKFWENIIESFKENMNIDEKELGVLYFASEVEEVVPIIEEHEAKLDKSKLKLIEADESGFLLKPSAKKIAEVYNKVAHMYHSAHSHRLVSLDQLKEFMELVNAPAKVLDLGTGPGYDAGYLSEKYSVTGIEVSEKFAQIAQFENPHVDIILGDFVTYDFGKSKYKGIWARDSLHHVHEKDLDNLFKKMSDALVEGGILYVIVREGKGEFVEKEQKSYGELERFYHLFTSDELANRAIKAGFELVKIDHKKRSHKWLIGVFKKKSE